MTYLNGTIYKHTERDNFDTGCTGETIYFELDIDFEAGIIDELKFKIAAFFDIELEDINIDEMNNRLEWGRMENTEGDKATQEELAEFKLNECVLYVANYSTCIYKQERVNLIGE
jgi:hypothetical protein